MPISGPKSTSSFHAGLRALGKSSTLTTRPTRMSSLSKSSMVATDRPTLGRSPLMKRGGYFDQANDLHPPLERLHRELTRLLERVAEQLDALLVPGRRQHAVGSGP